MYDVESAIERVRIYRRTGDCSDIMISAGIMMENCQTDERITIEDAFTLLDFPGAVAEFGARILYIKTGRDNVYTRSAAEDGVNFSSGKTDWENFLLANGFLSEAP